MSNNISKYLVLNPALLLEWEFSKDGVVTDLSSIGNKVATLYDTKQYFNILGNGETNNNLLLNSIPIDETRSNWYINPNDISSYYTYFDSSISVAQTSYALDKVKLHIIAGYNFDDVAGFLLQVRAQDTSNNFVDLSNFTWIKQLLGSNVIKFNSNALYLNGKFYDKYALLKVPSIAALGGDTTSLLGIALNIKQLSDVFINYSTISDINVNTFTINESITAQLPVTSLADNFNAFIAESTVGDYIEFYATWKDTIIGQYINDIESGVIPLYTSNNPNDNYQSFADQYGIDAVKWVVQHELYLYENIPTTGGGSSLLTQKYVFTQEDDFNNPNYFRPVIRNSDIATSYSITYICRLMNRMDGSQIIRQASFASKDPKKYGRVLTRINVENYIPFKVFNKIEKDAGNYITASNKIQTKFSKVYFDTTLVTLNQNNEIYPQGTGPLFLKSNDSTYIFEFDKIDTTNNNQKLNVDLSGAYNYGLLFILDDGTKIEVSPTYSSNMNTTIGTLEFKLLGSQISQLLKQTNNTYSIIIKNPDNSSYTFYQGLFYSYTDYNTVISQFTNLFNVTDLNTQISDLKVENNKLKTQVSTLQASNK